MTDPLASFRRSQPTTANQEKGTQAGLKTYEAFKTRERSPERLRIRRVLGETHSPSYHYLMDVSYNADQGTELVLIYSFMLVKVRGKHMQALINAIEEHTCLFIQDFHQNEFNLPPPQEAIIESIEIVRQEKDS